MDITEDQTSPEQLRESFRGIANDKVRAVHQSIYVYKVLSHWFQLYVTELDLRLAQLPTSAVDYLREVMPSRVDGDGEPEYDYESWLEEVFA